MIKPVTRSLLGRSQEDFHRRALNSMLVKFSHVLFFIAVIAFQTSRPVKFQMQDLSVHSLDTVALTVFKFMIFPLKEQLNEAVGLYQLCNFFVMPLNRVQFFFLV